MRPLTLALSAGVIALATATAAMAQERTPSEGRTPGEKASSAGVAPAVQGTCNPNRIRFRTETSVVQTSSLAYVDAPQTFQAITVGGVAPSCVMVTFSFDADNAPANASNWMAVRARIEGIGAAGDSQPPEHIVDIRRYDQHSVQFFFPDVPPGAHTVRIQFASFNPGNTVRMYNRSLAIQFRQ
jgi:hypothetical protein